MFYIVKFYKPTAADKQLEQKLASKSAAERWKKLVKNNGYEVINVRKEKATS